MGEKEEQKEKRLLSMQSRIIFLGTGTGKYIMGKQHRATGGIILQVYGNQFIIDPGPGSLIGAKECGVSFRENTGIIISHNHLCHCNDLNAVIDAMTYSGLDVHGVLVSNNSTVNGDDNETPYLTKYHRNQVEKVVVLEAGQKVGINEVEINAIKANHTDDSVGYKFVTPDFVLTYSADTEYSNALLDFYKGTDILILNVVHPGKTKGNGNLCTEDAIKIIENVKPRLTILTHFGVKMLEADPIYEARTIHKKTGCQVVSARDGMSISPASYAAKSNQKTLQGFK